jgi:hypothetical protein
MILEAQNCCTGFDQMMDFREAKENKKKLYSKSELKKINREHSK